MRCRTDLLLLLGLALSSLLPRTGACQDSDRPDKMTSIATRPATDRGWQMRLMGFGLGYGTRSNSGPGGRTSGFVVGVDAITFAFGFNGLGGVGFGTTIWETLASGGKEPPDESGTLQFSGNGMPCSLFPVYLYYPLSWTTRHSRFLESPGHIVRLANGQQPTAYLFAGGSGWAPYGSYLHAGVAKVFDLGEGPGLTARGPDLPMFAAIQASVFRSSGYALTPEGASEESFGARVGYNISLKLGYGGTGY